MPHKSGMPTDVHAVAAMTKLGRRALQKKQTRSAQFGVSVGRAVCGVDDAPAGKKPATCRSKQSTKAELTINLETRDGAKSDRLRSSEDRGFCPN
jgi:hypothetical protein